jgi:hypothetical protein
MPDVLVGYTEWLFSEAAQAAGVWVSALLTLATLSLVLGDNPAARLAQHLLVGTAAGYAGAVVCRSVLLPRLMMLIRNPSQHWAYALFFALGLGLLARSRRSVSSLTQLPLAVLFGTGAALALGGAVSGSLVPVIRASVPALAPDAHGGGLTGWFRVIDGLLACVCAIVVLSAFRFIRAAEGASARFWSPFMDALGHAGRKVMMVGFGALLAGALMAAQAVLRSRLEFLVNDWLSPVLRGGL